MADLTEPFDNIFDKDLLDRISSYTGQTREWVEGQLRKVFQVPDDISGLNEEVNVFKLVWWEPASLKGRYSRNGEVKMPTGNRELWKGDEMKAYVKCNTLQEAKLRIAYAYQGMPEPETIEWVSAEHV